ncbi:NCS2 family permease [Bacillota bacterium Meth-B3]|nr:NCS2 family permease [Christensenellaceae bacterium]
MSSLVNKLDQSFGVTKRGSTVKTELLAGLTTFATMAYILPVNVGILAASGLDGGAVFMATALGSVVGTVLMALLAGLPFALAPGMGLNAFFAFTIVIGFGYSPSFALAAVLTEGVIFILLSLTGIRQKLFNAIPLSVKNAVSAGIGLFIMFIGLQNCGFIIGNPATLVAINPNIYTPAVALALIGIIITIILYVKRVRGALLLGILLTWLIGVGAQLMGFYQVNPELKAFSLIPSGIFSMPPSMAPTFGLAFHGFGEAFRSVGDFGRFMMCMLTFLYVDIFDTLGTLSGVATKAKLLDQNGELPGLSGALLADAIGTAAGAIMGTSTVTTFVESAAGVEEGGRTGLTAMTTGILFLLSIFLYPIVSAIPSFATTCALVMVGIMMLEPLKDVDFGRVDHAIPAAFTMGLMVMGYSISTGLQWGVLSYVLVSVINKKSREVGPVMWVLCALFLIKMLIIDHL